MKTMITLRARCLYSRALQFTYNRLYTFERVFEYEYYDVYVTDDLYAFRFLGDATRLLVIEDLNGVVAVFEIVLESTCTA